MAIRIIKDGIENWRTVYKATCRRCHCIFICDKSDGEYRSQDFRGEGDFVDIKCPNCKDQCYAYPEKEPAPYRSNDMRGI